MRCTTTLVLTHLFACLAQAADPAPDRAGPVRSGPRPAALDAFIESHCAQCHHTRFWRGRGLVQSGELQPGQIVLFNLAWVTLYGPGRLTDIWLDEESRTLATAERDRPKGTGFLCQKPVDAGVFLGDRLPHEDGEAVGGGGGGWGVSGRKGQAFYALL